MSLTLRYEFTNNSITSIGSNRVRFGEFGVSQSAEVGEPTVSQFTWDDPAGEVTPIGLRIMSALETAAPSNNQVIWRGRVGARVVTRGPSMRTTVGRRWQIDASDENAILGWRLMMASSANRPAESASDRLTWLTGTRRVPVYAHPTLCSAPATAMDANDYRGQRYIDVLADIANATGYNFWCEYNEGRDRVELFFMNPGSSSYTSTLSISNDLSDVNSSTVFAPSEDAELRRDPSRITASAYIAYDGGYVYETRDSTGDQFAYVDQTAPLSNVKSAAKARAIAIRYLDDNDEEDDRITCSILVPAAQVNDIRAGHRIAVKFTHFPGYESYRYMRVLRRSVVQEEDLGQDYYRIFLDLSTGSAASTCSTALAAATADEVTGLESSTTTASVSSTITSDGYVVALLLGCNGNTPNAENMGNPSGYTVLDNQADYSRSTWSLAYKAVSAGTATASASFTPGFSSSGVWLAAQAWLPWTSVTVVQEKFGASSAAVATFDSPPTAGNTVLMLAVTGGLGTISLGGSFGPASGWTTLFDLQRSNSNALVQAALFARCVESGEGSTYEYQVNNPNLQINGCYLVEIATS